MKSRHLALTASVLLLFAACKSSQPQQKTTESSASSDDQTPSPVQQALDDPDNLLTESPMSAPPSGDKTGGTLRRRLNGRPAGFNWLTENGAQVSEIQEYVHGTFAERSAKNPKNWIPDLAYKVTVNDDHTEYTIHLREDVQWQKPAVDLSKPEHQWLNQDQTVDAEDCKFFFDMVQNSQVAAGAISAYYDEVERVEIVDKHTLRVVWREKLHDSLMATMSAYPLPKHIFTRTKTGEQIPEARLGAAFNRHWAGETPIGAGPYRLVKNDQGSRVVLERFDNYYGSAPPIERIEYSTMLKKQTYPRLKAGELDVAVINSDQYKRHVLNGDADSPFSDGTLKHRVVDRFAYHYIGWNLDKPMFSDAKTRRALTHALDRKGIIEDIYHGLGYVQSGPFYHKQKANSPKVEPYAYNLKKARTLLDQAGWRDNNEDGVREKKLNGESTDFRFSMVIYNDPTWRQIATTYESALRKIGVAMTVEPLPWPRMQKRMKSGRFGGYTGGWALSWGVQPYQIWHSTQADVPAGSNHVGFRNKRADELIEKLRVTFDRDERIKIARKFHELIHRQQPYTFILAPQQVYAWNSRVKNVQFRPIRPQDRSFQWYLDSDR